MVIFVNKRRNIMSFLFWKKDKNEKVTEKEIKTNSAALFKLD